MENDLFVGHKADFLPAHVGFYGGGNLVRAPYLFYLFGRLAHRSLRCFLRDHHHSMARKAALVRFYNTYTSTRN